MLKENGYTQTRIAKLLGVTVVHVNNVLSGKRKNPRVREVIALACRKRVEDIWPEPAKKKRE